jgi:integrase
VEEVPLVLAHVPRAWRDLIAAAIYTGMRRGELFALKKTSVDMDAGVLAVQASNDNDTTNGGHADLIPIAKDLRPFLERAMASKSDYVFPDANGRQRTEEADPHLVLRRALARAGLIVGCIHVCRRCKSKGLEHEHKHADTTIRNCPACDMKMWPKPIPRPMRFHDPRHTAGTLLLRAGVEAHRVQRLLRHRDVGITIGTYGHLVVEDLRGAVDRMAPLPAHADTRSRLAVENPANLVTRWLPDTDSPKEKAGSTPKSEVNPASSKSGKRDLKRRRVYQKHSAERAITPQHPETLHFPVPSCPL